MQKFQNMEHSNSRTFQGLFKDLKGPTLFSRTFKGLEFFCQNSRTFKDFSRTLWTLHFIPWIFGHGNTMWHTMVQPYHGMPHGIPIKSVCAHHFRYPTHTSPIADDAYPYLYLTSAENVHPTHGYTRTRSLHVGLLLLRIIGLWQLTSPPCHCIAIKDLHLLHASSQPMPKL